MSELVRRRLRPAQLPDVVVAKWSGAVLDEGFVPFPKRLVRCLAKVFRGPDALARLAVVLAIVDFRRPNLKTKPSLEFLAFVAGLPPDEFRAILRRLGDENLACCTGPESDLDIRIDGLLRRIIEYSADESDARGDSGDD